MNTRVSKIEQSKRYIVLSLVILHTPTFNKHKDLSSDPPKPCKKLGIIVFFCKPSFGESETGGSLGLA